MVFLEDTGCLMEDFTELIFLVDGGPQQQVGTGHGGDTLTPINQVFLEAFTIQGSATLLDV